VCSASCSILRRVPFLPDFWCLGFGIGPMYAGVRSNYCASFLLEERRRLFRFGANPCRKDFSLWFLDSVPNLDCSKNYSVPDYQDVCSVLILLNFLSTCDIPF